MAETVITAGDPAAVTLYSGTHLRSGDPIHDCLEIDGGWAFQG